MEIRLYSTVNYHAMLTVPYRQKKWSRLQYPKCLKGYLAFSSILPDYRNYSTCLEY